jgi:hypothetical protein
LRCHIKSPSSRSATSHLAPRTGRLLALPLPQLNLLRNMIHDFLLFSLLQVAEESFRHHVSGLCVHEKVLVIAENLNPEKRYKTLDSLYFYLPRGTRCDACDLLQHCAPTDAVLACMQDESDVCEVEFLI